MRASLWEKPNHDRLSQTQLNHPDCDVMVAVKREEVEEGVGRCGKVWEGVGGCRKVWEGGEVNG